MSQDLRRERAGAKFDTIAGATNYIAQLEKYRHGTPVFHVIPRDKEMEDLECTISQLREALGYVCMYADEADIRAYAAEALAHNRA